MDWFCCSNCVSTVQKAEWHTKRNWIKFIIKKMWCVTTPSEFLPHWMWLDLISTYISSQSDRTHWYWCTEYIQCACTGCKETADAALLSRSHGGGFVCVWGVGGWQAQTHFTRPLCCSTQLCADTTVVIIESIKHLMFNVLVNPQEHKVK